MKNKLLPYGISFCLTALLLLGLSCFGGEAYGQWKYPNKVLESVKKKKEKKKKLRKKELKPDPSNGSEVYILKEDPLMVSPGMGNKKLPQKDEYYQPELNKKKNLPLKQKKKEKGTEGTEFAGRRRRKDTHITEPGKGQDKSSRDIAWHQEWQGTSFKGFIKMKKSWIRKPGVHHEDRPNSWSRRYQNSTDAASYAGNRKIRQNDSHITEPGKGQDKSSRDIAWHQEWQGTSFKGSIKMKKSWIRKPGVHHEDRPVSWSRRYQNSTDAASYPGSQKTFRKYIAKPGVHHLDRNMNRAGQYESTDAANHPGSFRVKKKHLKEPGTLYSERKPTLANQYSSSAYTEFQGHMKAMSRKQKARYYEKQSEKIHQYQGSIKVKLSHKNMHPSAAARKTTNMRSKKQADRTRAVHKWWNRLWKRDQPEVVKEKPRKPRYEKDENEIWDKSRDW